MLSANFKPKRTATASRGFLAIARLSCFLSSGVANNYQANTLVPGKMEDVTLIPLTVSLRIFTLRPQYKI